MKWRDARGGQHNRSASTRDKAIAQRLARKIEADIALSPHGLAVTPVDVSRRWSQLVDDFCSSQSKLREASVASYRHCGSAVQKELGDVVLVDVTKALIESFVNKRLAAEIAKATINKELRHIRRMLNWARERGELRTTPGFKGLFLREDVCIPKTVSAATFEALLAALNDPKLVLVRESAHWWRVFLRLLHWTGCRRGELLGLEWRSVDFIDGKVTVLATTSKGRRDKVLPLSKAVLETLQDWFAASGAPPGEAKVVPWKAGVRQLYDEFKTIETAADVPHHKFKDYRSSRGCALANAGESTLVIRDWLGHASVATTEKFYASARNRLPAAAAKLEAAEAGTIPGTTENAAPLGTP